MHEFSFFIVGGGKKTNFSVDAKVNGRPFPLFRNPRRVAIPFTFLQSFQSSSLQDSLGVQKGEGGWFTILLFIGSINQTSGLVPILAGERSERAHTTF